MNTLLTEVIVLTTIGWLATLYAWRQAWQRRRQHQQQAWQWWHQQNAIQSHHTAELIRDGLLQQTFAFRRYLETISTSNSRTEPAVGCADPTDKQTNQWLARFQTFHNSLETLSDELSPPFVADSLPHALQFTLKNWQAAQKLPPFQIELPQNWNQGQSTPQQNQAVLSIISALLSLILPSGHSASQVSAILTHQDSLNILIVTVEYNKPPPQEQPELTYLKEIFHSLTTGQLEITHQTLSITSRLSWQNIDLPS